jgi:hypothetical protein
MQRLSSSFVLTWIVLSAPPTAQWTQMNSPTAGRSGFICSDGAHLYAITEPGWLFRSTNEGEPWNVSGQIPRGAALSLAVSGDTVLVGTVDGIIYRSTNQGATFTALKKQFVVQTNTSIIYYTVSALAIHDSRYYAGVWGLGFYISSDHGETWALQDDGYMNDTQGFVKFGTKLLGITNRAFLS